MHFKQMIFIGYDPRPAEVTAYAVARSSIRHNLSMVVPMRPLILSKLRRDGIYYRPTSVHDGRLWDTISAAPMSTEFALSRFLVPYLAKSGLALFVDGDVMARTNVLRIFDEVDLNKAVSVVKHKFDPPVGMKMDGQVQTSYQKKNWSSVMVFNCEHPSNYRLSPEYINHQRGLNLHQFCWLDEAEIGELDPKWNYLVGHSKCEQPAIVHFTDGTPSMPGYENVEYADEWRIELERWAQ